MERQGSAGGAHAGDALNSTIGTLLAPLERRLDSLLAARRAANAYPTSPIISLGSPTQSSSGTGCRSQFPRRKKVVKDELCDPVARGAHDVAHRLSDSIELNNPRGSGEGHGRTFSPEGSEEELLEASSMKPRSKAWFQGRSPLLIGSRGFHASQGEKRAPRPR